MKYLKLIRPKQWLKNCFVLSPLIFSGEVNFDLVIIALKITFIFILTSSCIYILNDIKDIEYDKKHPEKKFRPLASGQIKIKDAIIFLFALIIINLYVIHIFNISYEGIFLLSIYSVLNILYSYGLKNIPLLELAILASGFIIRLLVGAQETSITLSPWIIICSGLLSLMIAVGKRRNDLKHQEKNDGPIRISLHGYNIEFLDHVNSMLAGVNIVCYLLFCVSQYPFASIGSNLLWTSPFVIFSILRYLQLTSINDLGEDPTAMLISDKTSIILFTIWLILIMNIIYLN